MGLKPEGPVKMLFLLTLGGTERDVMSKEKKNRKWDHLNLQKTYDINCNFTLVERLLF